MASDLSEYEKAIADIALDELAATEVPQEFWPPIEITP